MTNRQVKVFSRYAKATIMLIVFCNADQVRAEDESVESNEDFFELSASIIGGAESFSEFYSKEGESGEESFIRKAKLGFDFEFDRYWKVQLELTTKQEDGEFESKFGDAYVSYSGLRMGKFKLGKLKLGHFKEPFGFGRLTSLSNIHTNERSLTTSSFTPGRNYGLQIENKKKTWTWSIGYFQDNESDEKSNGLTARVTHTNYFDDFHLLHLGYAYSSKDLNANEFQIKEEAGLFSAQNVIRSAQFNADKSTSHGGEVFWQKDAMSFTGEYISQTVKQVDGTNWQYSGYYLQASYFFGGARMRYQKGKLKSVKLESGQSAWEWVIRYNYTDLRDQQLGSETQIIETGINYYYKEPMILKLSLYNANIEGNRLSSESKGDAVSLRVVYKIN